MSLMLHRAGLLRPSLAPPTPVAPDAFEPAHWSLAPGNEKADVAINSLPGNGGATITDIEYRVDGGTWVSSGGTSGFAIPDLANGEEYDVELRAVNSIGAGAGSDTKSVTPQSAEFDPLDLSPMLFFDLSDAATLKQERTGGSATTPSAADEVIGSIQNKGSAGGWATAFTDSARAILRVSGGLSYAESDGIDDGYDFDWSSSNANMWVVAGLRMLASGPWVRIISLSASDSFADSNNTNGVAPLLRNNENNQLASYHNGGVRSTVALVMGVDHVADVQFSGSGNAVAVDGGTPATASFGFAPNFTVGRLLHAFETGYRGSYMQGRLYCLIAGTGTLNSRDRDDLVAWVAAKSGVTL
jgi:hypothetical protein